MENNYVDSSPDLSYQHEDHSFDNIDAAVSEGRRLISVKHSFPDDDYTYDYKHKYSNIYENINPTSCLNSFKIDINKYIKLNLLIYPLHITIIKTTLKTLIKEKRKSMARTLC